MVAEILTRLLCVVVFLSNGTSPQRPPTADSSTDTPIISQQDTAALLDGRKLVVRQYADWQNAPGKFELLSIDIKNHHVAIDPPKAGRPPFLVVTAEDQEDSVVREAVGSRVWAQSLMSQFDLWLPFFRDEEYACPFWRFTDALGEPLAKASVDIWLVDHRGPRIRFGQATVDPAGRLGWKASQGYPHLVEFIVSHADYGCARVRAPLESGTQIITPLVRRGTTAADRAIRGRVVDPSGEPVVGATIRCPHARTLGEGLIDGLDDTYEGITDADGRFSFYLLNRKVRDDRGELIPPKSRYYVRIEAPHSSGLLPYVDPIENGRETLVVLERGNRLRRLRFEDQDGEITDPAKLRTIVIQLRRSGRNVLTLYYDNWRDGVPLVPGTYEASMQTTEKCSFEPVDLTEDGPDEMVFRLAAPVTYYGRVVHGITGRPMPGAFVLAMSSNASDLRLEDLTREQWDALHAIESNPAVEDKALDPLRKMYGFVSLVRADATGGYGVVLEAHESFYGFIVFEQDYLAVMRRKHALAADEARFAEVPAIKLFPAATVFVETSTDKEFLSIMPTWQTDDGTRPGWVQELLAVDDGRESRLECHDWVKPNARQAIHVPSGVSLRLTLETPYDEEFCPIPIPQAIRLAQGQTADLGRFTFERAVPVQVKAVDSDGQALEGIPLRLVHMQPDGLPSWGVPHVTDEQGIARFHVLPNSSGSFGVLYHDEAGVSLRETVDYEVGGPEDTGHEFVLSLSNEMLAHLLK